MRNHFSRVSDLQLFDLRGALLNFSEEQMPIRMFRAATHTGCPSIMTMMSQLSVDGATHNLSSSALWRSPVASRSISGGDAIAATLVPGKLFSVQRQKAGVFGAGKTRSLAVWLIALSCELDDFSAVVFTKENVAAKALADQVSDLTPPTLAQIGRLLGRIEKGKGEVYATRIVRCSDRNRIISSKRILIATGGSATAEMSMRYSTFSQWLSRIWLAFMDESQQYGNYHEIAALAAIQQPALIAFVGDHRQTPGGLSKGRAAAANRQKLLQRPLGLRALNRPGDYLPPHD